MTRRTILATFQLLLLCLACHSKPDSSSASHERFDPLECRIELDDPASKEAVDKTAPWKGSMIKLGPPRMFHVQSASIEGDAVLGMVAFELTPEDHAPFTEYTKANIGRNLAILVDGDVVTLARIASSLPGKGVLSVGDGSNGKGAAAVLEKMHAAH